MGCFAYCSSKDKTVDQVCENQGVCMYLALKLILMVVLIVLISLSNDISNAKPCELQRALASIDLTNTPHSCKFNTTKEWSDTLEKAGITDLILQFVMFGVAMFIYVLWREEKPNKIPNIVPCSIYICISVLAVSLLFLSVWMYITFERRGEDNVFDFVALKKSMLSSLETNYKSDNISNSDAKSWNIFFIKYDCCAVNEVTGTLNDFDKTPWCTTAGSCQDTSSQIPRTCCKSVTQDDYHNAPRDCYFSVKDGTYKSSCFSRMRSLSRESINEFQLSFISILLHVSLIVKVVECILIIRLFFWMKRNTTLCSANGAGSTSSSKQDDNQLAAIGDENTGTKF